MHQLHLARPAAFDAADDANELAVFVELHDARINIAIRDKDIAVLREESSCRAIERGMRGVVTGDAARPDRRECRDDILNGNGPRGLSMTKESKTAEQLSNMVVSC